MYTFVTGVQEQKHTCALKAEGLAYISASAFIISSLGPCLKL